MRRTTARGILVLGCLLLLGAVGAPELPHPIVILVGLAGALLLSLSVLASGDRRLDPRRRRVVRVGAVLMALQLTGLARAFRVSVVHPDETADRRVVANDEAILTNPRVASRRIDQPRGRILAADGTVLARSRSTDAGLRREYDEPSVHSIVGYVSPLKFGLGGLEASLDGPLTGSADPTIGDALERALLDRAGATSTVHLTIEMPLQRLAADLLVGLTGSIVLLDCETGWIRAMASSPTIDPNRLHAIDGETSASAQAYWDELLADPWTPLLSRATMGLYPPGSTFKVITAAAAIEVGVASPDTVYEDTGELEIDGRLLLERNRPDTDQTAFSLSEALAYSLNLVYAEVGLQVGETEMRRVAEAFGIGETIPIDLPTASGQIASSASFLSGEAALADTAFGQGELLVTPLHMALVATAVAREGTIPVPTIVDRVTRDGEVVERTLPTVWRRAMSPETATKLDEMMVESATYGYARTAAVEGVRIAAKTGTAESGRDVPHSWFIGYRADDDRSTAVAVCIEFGGEGGGLALTVGRSLLEAS